MDNMIAKNNLEASTVFIDYFKKRFSAAGILKEMEPQLSAVSERVAAMTAAGLSVMSVECANALIVSWDVVMTASALKDVLRQQEFLKPETLPKDYSAGTHARLDGILGSAPFLKPTVQISKTDLAFEDIYNLDVFQILLDIMHSAIEKNVAFLREHNGIVAAASSQSFKRGKSFSRYLFSIYENFGVTTRTRLNCSTCRVFIQALAPLVVLLPSGNTRSLLWNIDDLDDLGLGSDIEAPFKKFFAAMAEYFEDIPVTNVVTKTWVTHSASLTGMTPDHYDFGVVEKGGHPHFHCRLPINIFRATLTPTRYGCDTILNLNRQCKRWVTSMGEGVWQNAIDILRSEPDLSLQIERDGLDWWKDYADRVNQSGTHPLIFNSQIHMLATAPGNVMGLKDKATGSFIADLADPDMNTPGALANLRRYLDPKNYMRSTTRASGDQEKDVLTEWEVNGVIRSFTRRFATLSDLVAFKHTYYLDASSTKEPSDVDRTDPSQVAAALIASAGKSEPTQSSWTDVAEKVRHLKPVPTTIEMFLKELPSIEKMWSPVAGGLYGKNLPFILFSTAVDLAAPPILRWDTNEKRDPICPFMLAGFESTSFSEYTDGLGFVPEISAVIDLRIPEGVNVRGNPYLGLIFKGYHIPKSRVQRIGVPLFSEVLNSELMDTKVKRRVIETLTSHMAVDQSTTPYTECACGFALSKTLSSGANGQTVIVAKHKDGSLRVYAILGSSEG